MKFRTGEADANEDGAIFAPELFEYVQTRVRRRAGLEGLSQEPIALGLDELTLSWSVGAQ